MKRVKGFETGLLVVESKLDKIFRESEQATTNLQSVDTRLDKQEKDFIKMKKDLERALQARPLAQSGDGVTANNQGGVTTAKNQSGSFWPGSVAPPPLFPPLGAVFSTAPTDGQPAAAQE